MAKLIFFINQVGYYWLNSVGNNCVVMELSIGIRYSNQLKYLLRLIISRCKRRSFSFSYELKSLVIVIIIIIY